MHAPCKMEKRQHRDGQTVKAPLPTHKSQPSEVTNCHLSPGPVRAGIVLSSFLFILLIQSISESRHFAS